MIGQSTAEIVSTKLDEEDWSRLDKAFLEAKLTGIYLTEDPTSIIKLRKWKHCSTTREIPKYKLIKQPLQALLISILHLWKLRVEKLLMGERYNSSNNKQWQLSA